MALDLPGVRPAVLKQETMTLLRQVLKFRHFVRHAYAVAWEQARVVDMEQRVRESWSHAERDLTAFIAFLDQAGT